MNIDDVEEYIATWRASKSIDDPGPLTEAQTIDFALGLQDKIGALSVRPEREVGVTGKFAEWDADASVIPYSGLAGDVPAFKIAKAMSENGEGRVFYISDTPAGACINDTTLQELVLKEIGGNDKDFGKAMRDRIFHGTYDPDSHVRSKFALADVVALDDFVSANLMKTATGDVRCIIPNAAADKVFAQTELKVLLEQEDVTALNGIPKEDLLRIYRETESYFEVSKVIAEACQGLMNGTRYTLSIDGASPTNREVDVVAVDGAPLYQNSGVAGPDFAAGAAKVEVISLPPQACRIAVLTIDNFDTAAFKELGRNGEMASILTDAAEKIRDGVSPPFTLQDTDGNDIGRVDIKTSLADVYQENAAARIQFDLAQPAFQQDQRPALAQAIMAAAQQLYTNASANHMAITAPDGQSLGKLNITPPAEPSKPDPALAVHEHAEYASP